MSETSNSRTNSPGKSIGFDPFRIGPNHVYHSQSTSIIKLDESGRIFCPMCLESVSLEGMDSGGNKTYDQYMKNMLEVLDQHSEQIQLRRIVLKIFEIMLKKRCISVKSDTEFHNVIRIFYKIMKSDQFDSSEFPPIVNIHSIMQANYGNSNPIPFALIWKTTQHMLNYSEGELDKTLGGDIPLSDDLCKFIESVATLIKTHLEILTRFGSNQTSDKIFLLLENDCMQPQDKKCHSDSQLYCINFVSQKLLAKCWKFLKTSSRKLTSAEKVVITEIINTLEVCLATSIKIKHFELLEYLCENDFLQVAYSLIIKNDGLHFRNTSRALINLIVKHYIVLHFGTDDGFEQFIGSSDIVEINHKNAIAYSRNEEKHKKTTYYILLNCVALILKSDYFVSARVQKVIKAIDPVPMNLKQSKVLMRAYLYTAAHVTRKVTQYENVRDYVLNLLVWMQRKKYYTLFDEQFCFNETVLYWIYEQPEFIKLVKAHTIKYILEDWALEKKLVTTILMKLLKHKDYIGLITRYLREQDSSINVIEEIVKYDSEQQVMDPNSVAHEELVSRLSHITLSNFHGSIIYSINVEEQDTTGNEMICRAISIIVTMMKKCEHFKFHLDDGYIMDIFRFLEMKYKNLNIQESEDALILMNEFISLLMTTNSPYLLKVLKYLDFFILGYMYQRLADYTRGDLLAESIAGLLVTYDNIDYPLLQNIGKSLNTMALSVVNWMLSRNENLHILSLMIGKNVLNTDIQDSIRACITTGLIHMLSANSKILENRVYMNYLLTIVEVDAFKYNPLVKYALHALPTKLRDEIKQKLSENDDRPQSPPMSFSSGGTSYFEEQQCTVSQILNQLNEEDEPGTSSRIPDSLYIAGGLKDQHLKTDDTDEWERRAYEANADAF